MQDRGSSAACYTFEYTGIVACETLVAVPAKGYSNFQGNARKAVQLIKIACEGTAVAKCRV